MITMYDYQEDAYHSIKEAFKVQPAVLIVMASGLGKTITSGFFAVDEYRQGKRGLFLCHENDILDQALIEYRAIFGNKATLRTFYGTDKDWNADNADVLFASFQSFNEWHQAFDKTHFDYIIVDESHHGQAPTFKEVIKYFTPEKLLGMTATPDRMDGKEIREIFGDEVVNYPIELALINSWLTKVEYRILNDGLNNKKLRQIAKEILEGRRISVTQLNETIFIKQRDEEIAKIVEEYSQNKKTIIFCENIDHANNFSKYLPGSVVFHSKITASENRQSLIDFRAGKIQYILAVNKFNEGIDIPDAEVIVFLRATDSLTIFFQQLGRGLRKIINKEKVIILDFVANCERLIHLRELVGKIKELSGAGFNLSKDKLFIDGEAFRFIFTDEQIDIFNILDRLSVEFYPTWQEASAATIGLGIKSQSDYFKKYKANPRLPSHPPQLYVSFPGWTLFFGGIPKEFYSTWQEASKATIGLGIKSERQYFRKYKVDLKLPSTPGYSYADFPGWSIFFGKTPKEFYSTWQEAGKAAVKLGIKGDRSYRIKYKKNLKLPSHPEESYADFPGWTVFLGGKSKEFYSTWQEAGKAAIKIGINGFRSYWKKYKIDPKLPSDPSVFYTDFPGWTVFLGGKSKEFYSTWQEAGKAAIKLGITGYKDHIKKYRIDPKLPSNPGVFYTDFPGWTVFLKK